LAVRAGQSASPSTFLISSIIRVNRRSPNSQTPSHPALSAMPAGEIVAARWLDRHSLEKREA
jgi:hypothetical protein